MSTFTYYQRISTSCLFLNSQENQVSYPRSDAIRTYLTSEIHNDIDINFDEDLIHQLTQEGIIKTKFLQQLPWIQYKEFL